MSRSHLCPFLFQPTAMNQIFKLPEVDFLRRELQNAGYVSQMLLETAFPIVFQFPYDDIFWWCNPDPFALKNNLSSLGESPSMKLILPGEIYVRFGPCCMIDEIKMSAIGAPHFYSQDLRRRTVELCGREG